MALRSKDFVGLAEKIKSDELSTKGKIESLENKKIELSNTKSNIFENIAYIDAQIMAAFEDTDEDGNPNYSRIAMLQAQKHLEEIELQSVENDIVNNNADIEQTKDKLENVLDEKEQTLFEIQERARKSSQNIKTAGGMYGVYAGVGQAVQNSMQTSLSALSKAASILGGTVDTSGASNGSNLQVGSGKAQTTAGLNKTLSAGNLLGFTGGNTSQGVSSENYISEQRGNVVSSFVPNYRSGQKSINPEAEINYNSRQEGMHIINAFQIADSNDNQEDEGAAANFISEQNSSINILDNTNSDDIMDPKQQLAAYMNAHNYGKADYLIYSQDPEWQRLHQMAYPERHTESALKGTEWAKQQLAAHMNAHNYHIVDYPIYSRDPEWQRLHQMAYPDRYPEQSIKNKNDDFKDKSHKIQKQYEHRNLITSYNEAVNAVVDDVQRGTGRKITYEKAERLYHGIQDFSGERYAEIRDAYNNPSAPKEDKILMEFVDEYIHNAPKWSGKVYRGIQVSSATAKAIIKNKKVDMLGPSSWSSEIEVARSFAHVYGVEDTHMIFVLSENKSGASITHLAKYNGMESEVTAPSGIIYTIDEVKKITHNKKQYMYVYVHE